jgi:hypothetical protein
MSDQKSNTISGQEVSGSNSKSNMGNVGNTEDENRGKRPLSENDSSNEPEKRRRINDNIKSNKDEISQENLDNVKEKISIDEVVIQLKKTSKIEDLIPSLSKINIEDILNSTNEHANFHLQDSLCFGMFD